jgi:CRP-like cAMP-binding protein
VLEFPSHARRTPVRGTPPSRGPEVVATAASELVMRNPVLVLPPRNRLLGALPPATLAALLPHLELVHFEQGTMLFDTAAPIRFVFFPETAVVSLVSTFEDGGTVEIGTAGREGMVGLPVFLGARTSPVSGFTQIPGTAARLDTATFGRLAGAPGPLHGMMLHYTQAFLSQVSQTAACNATHLVEQRCARWLLMTHDRVEGDEFPLTHEFLALMLNVRRAGVTLAMRALQDAGLVRYTRGHVTVVNRAGLERSSCECYRVVTAHHERLLGQTVPCPGGTP